MKAQTVKNARHRAGRRQGRLRAQAACRPARPRGGAGRGHRRATGSFIRALLDLTDNVARRARSCRRPTSCATTATTPTSSSPPTRARRPSPTSPTRSSAEYGFWLGDAFASGGSAGYDHKEMGITAARRLGVREAPLPRDRASTSQTQDFTVAGIGDMSGDVFGNGMLLSPHIRLLAAFDHRHIFLDPDPDAARSLRRAPAAVRPAAVDAGTTTTRALISTGGGVFPRDAKTIALSPQARALLGIDADARDAGRRHPRDPAGCRSTCSGTAASAPT